MKNLLTILLSLVSVAVFAQFDKYFENRTMRVDYYHAGDSKNDYYAENITKNILFRHSVI